MTDLAAEKLGAYWGAYHVGQMRPPILNLQFNTQLSVRMVDALCIGIHDRTTPLDDQLEDTLGATNGIKYHPANR